MRILLVIAFFICLAAAEVPPWMLGDEQQMKCYFLNKTEIATPPHIRLAWTAAPPAEMFSDTAFGIRYNVEIDSAFWTSSEAAALLQGDLPTWQAKCTTTQASCTTSSSSNCCVFHSNLHSCRSNTGVCSPWVTPQNCSSGGSCSAGTVLVTHTSAKVGGVEEYQHSLQLQEGSWIVIAHIKIMNFQCAVGATRTVHMRPEETVSQAWIIGLVVALVAVVFGALFAVFMVHSRAQEAVRDTSFAPKEAPLAIVFTDIQDSTKLWGELTMSMAVALDTHHDVIRKAIRKYKGYEVKTVGDSFMIAIKDPNDAVKLACEIQEQLQQSRWPVCITNLYDGPSLGGLDDEPDDLQRLDCPYNGLRVRIGVHFGAPSITFDDTSMGYDYYGPPVNVAARVESVGRGGQILVSDDVRRACDPSTLWTFASVGAAELKGVKDSMELFMCNVAGCPKRSFEGLRAVADTAADGDGTDTDISDGIDNRSVGSRASMASRRDTYTFDSRKVFNNRHPLVQNGDLTVEALRFLATERLTIYESLLKPFKPAQREKVVKDLCDGWHVSALKGAKYIERNLCHLISRVLVSEGGTAVQPLSNSMLSKGSFTVKTPEWSPLNSRNPNPNSPGSPALLPSSSSGAFTKDN